MAATALRSHHQQRRLNSPAPPQASPSPSAVNLFRSFTRVALSSGSTARVSNGGLVEVPPPELSGDSNPMTAVHPVNVVPAAATTRTSSTSQACGSRRRLGVDADGSGEKRSPSSTASRWTRADGWGWTTCYPSSTASRWTRATTPCKEMIPKISDFGMARIFGGRRGRERSEHQEGRGYMSPEYAMDGVFSVKSDIFSFGVLVLEIVSGKRNRGVYLSDPTLNLLGYAWSLWRAGIGLELVDSSMTDSYPAAEALKCIKVGLLCVQERPEDRPTMASVVLMLGGDTASLPQPKQSGFVATRGPSEGLSPSSRGEFCSVNDVTLRMLQAR